MKQEFTVEFYAEQNYAFSAGKPFESVGLAHLDNARKMHPDCTFLEWRENRLDVKIVLSEAQARQYTKVFACQGKYRVLVPKNYIMRFGAGIAYRVICGNPGDLAGFSVPVHDDIILQNWIADGCLLKWGFEEENSK